MRNRYRFSGDTGFTLLEVLVTLFISTILFTILAAALHHIVSVQSRVEERAVALHDLQQTNLFLSHDLSRAMAHAVHDVNKKNIPFIGSAKRFTLTKPDSLIGTDAHSKALLVNVQYALSKGALFRKTWSATEVGAVRYAHARLLLSHLTEGHFEYLDTANQFHATWPPSEGVPEALPRAVRVVLTMSGWGVMSQLYPIPSAAHAAP